MQEDTKTGLVLVVAVVAIILFAVVLMVALSTKITDPQACYDSGAQAIYANDSQFFKSPENCELYLKANGLTSQEKVCQDFRQCIDRNKQSALPCDPWTAVDEANSHMICGSGPGCIVNGVTCGWCQPCVCDMANNRICKME